MGEGKNGLQPKISLKKIGSYLGIGTGIVSLAISEKIAYQRGQADGIKTVAKQVIPIARKAENLETAQTLEDAAMIADSESIRDGAKEKWTLGVGAVACALGAAADRYKRKQKNSEKNR